MSSFKLGTEAWLLPLAVVVMAVEWILLVAGTRAHEMMVGAGSTLLSALFLAAVCRKSTLELLPRASDIVTGWRIPWYVLSDCYILSEVLVRDLFTSRRAKSFYRVSGFKTSKDDPLLLGRSVLATVYTSASPNSIVIGIDSRQSKMLFHQIERSGVSRMTRRLGGRS